MDAALGILRTTPPADFEKTLKGLQSLVVGDETIEAVKKRIQVPFEIYNANEATEEEELPIDGEKSFLKTRYNKLGNSYRSPFTNQYYPKLSSSLPALSEGEEQIRVLESRANEIWDAYRILYYGVEAIGSVYLYQKPQLNTKSSKGVGGEGGTGGDLGGGGGEGGSGGDLGGGEGGSGGDLGGGGGGGVLAGGGTGDAQKSNNTTRSTYGSFQGLFGIQKNCTDSGSSWNSIHIVYVDDPIPTMSDPRQHHEWKCTYRIESTVLLVLHPTYTTTKATITTKKARTDISASITKNTTKVMQVQPTKIEISHLENIGTILEDIEIDIRSNLELVHIPRTKQIVDTIQSDEQRQLQTKQKKSKAMMAVIQESDVWKKRHQQVEAQEQQFNLQQQQQQQQQQQNS